MKTLNNKIGMKLKLLSIITIILLTQSCGKEEYPNVEHKTNYYYLTAAQLNQTPYFTNTAFDTISYTSDKGDTLTFVKTKTDTTWYCENGNGNPNTGYDKNCYQTIHNTYSAIKGNGSFDVKHIKPNSYLNTYLHVKFNNYTFYYDEVAINNVLFPTYIGTVLKFEKAIYAYNNDTDSLSAISYINKDFGLFLLKDKLNNSQYIITK